MVQRTLPQLIAQREIGCCSAISRNFSSGQKCQITDRFLPNKRQVLLKYRQKAFCGSYSDDGDLFLSACQGKYHQSGSFINDVTHNFNSRPFMLLCAIIQGWNVICNIFPYFVRYSQKKILSHFDFMVS